MRAVGLAAFAAANAMLAGCGPLGLAGKADGEASAKAAAAPPAAAPAGARPGAPASGPRGEGGDGRGLGGKNGGAIQASAGTNGESAIVDRAYLLGRWTDSGNCDRAVDFKPDGRFRGFDGTIGVWNVAADRLTVTTAQRTVTMQIVPVDRHRLTVVNQDGSLGQSSRC